MSTKLIRGVPDKMRNPEQLAIALRDLIEEIAKSSDFEFTQASYLEDLKCELDRLTWSTKAQEALSILPVWLTDIAFR